MSDMPPALLTADEIKAEWLKCSESPLYFIDTYVQIYNATRQAWLRFLLWPFQAWALRRVLEHRQLVILKARQLGMTWLLLGFILWLVLFRAPSAVGIFSKREEESIDLLDNRLKEMYKRLPDWLRSKETISDNKKLWQLSNGSWVRAFPTTAGDSYTFTFVLVDEADLAPDLGKLLGAVKPTTDAGGWLVLLSRVDKSTPQSTFKKIYRAAKLRLNDWFPMFLPWNVHPERNQTWYEAQARDSMAQTTTLDIVWEQYPATDTEALAPKSLDKRIKPKWIEAVYKPMEALETPDAAPGIPMLEVYALPEPGKAYVIGADPAEGNPSSDDSALTVMDAITGEEVAALAAKVEPRVFGSYIHQIGMFYNQAVVLCERNNHGHLVLGWLDDYSGLSLALGPDGKVGWLTNSLGKALMYDACAETFRTKDTVLHSFATYTQISSIEGASLSAPQGEADDRATSYALANLARAAAIFVRGQQGETLVLDERVEISEF